MKKRNTYRMWMLQFKNDVGNYGYLSRKMDYDYYFPDSEEYLDNFGYIIGIGARGIVIDLFRTTWIMYEESYGERDD